MAKAKGAVRQCAWLMLLGLWSCTSSSGMQTNAAGDAKAVHDFEGSWAADLPGGTVTFTACEDLTQSDSPYTCGTLYAVRSDGRGAGRKVDLEPSGCGGCNYDVSAFFAGTLNFPGAAPIAVRVILELATDNEPNLYDGQYHVIVVPDGSGSLRIDGSYENDTIVSATFYVESQRGTDGGTIERKDVGIAFQHESATGCPN